GLSALARWLTASKESSSKDTWERARPPLVSGRTRTRSSRASGRSSPNGTWPSGDCVDTRTSPDTESSPEMVREASTCMQPASSAQITMDTASSSARQRCRAREGLPFIAEIFPLRTGFRRVAKSRQRGAPRLSRDSVASMGADHEGVHEISDRFVDELAELDPIAATYLGVPGGEDELTDYSPDGHRARAELARRALEAVRRAEPADESERIARAVFVERVGLDVELHEAGADMSSLNVIASPVQDLR